MADESELNVAGEEIFQYLVQNSSDIISLITENGKILYKSQAVFPCLGYQPDELVGKNVLDYIHPDDQAEVKREFEHLLSKPGPGIRLEVRFRHKNGSWHYLESIGNNQLHNPKFKSIVINSRDITSHKRIEQKLASKLYELDTFIYRLSHDLRGPLTSIEGLITIAAESAGDEDTREILTKINQCNFRLKSLLDQLSTVAAISQAPIRQNPVDIPMLIQYIVEVTQQEPEALGVKFETDLDLSGKVLTDEALVYSAIEPLVDNAVRYKKGNIDAIVRIAAKQFEDKIRVEVEDNGQGIPEPHQSKIYDLFYKANRNSTGHGLGLYAVKNALEKLNGTIQLESYPNHGSRFVLDIPVGLYQ